MDQTHEGGDDDDGSTELKYDDDGDDDDDVDDDDESEDDDSERNSAWESISLSFGRITQLNLSICIPKTSVANTWVQMLSVSLFQAKADWMHLR